MTDEQASQSISLPTVEETNNPFLSAHVSIKPPPFMPKSVNGWLAIMEAQFYLARITAEDTRFFHTIAALPADVVSQMNPETLASRSYSRLKVSLESAFSRSKTELLEDLLSRTTLVGRPSAFMVDLRQTASMAGAGDDLVRHRFLQALPTAISTALAAQRDLTLDQLGSLADELVPLARSCYGVSGTVAESPRQHGMGSSAYQATAGIEEAAAYRGDFEGPRGGLPRSVRPFRYGQQPLVCRAHLYYGSSARTCRTWCQWPNKPQHVSVLPPSRPTSRSASPVPALSQQEN